MAAITSVSELINRLTGGNSGTPELLIWEKMPYRGTTIQIEVAEYRYSFWRYEGWPSAGATPTTPATLDKSSAGAIPFTSPGGGRTKWITSVMVAFDGSMGDEAVLYDRLLHMGGLSGTVTSAQTVGGTLARNTGGEGNRIYLDVYSVLGSTERTVTASYTNQAGTSGRTTQAWPIGGSTSAAFWNDDNAFYELPLQDDDTGVQSVQSVTLSASTGGAGDFGITIGRPLLRCPIAGLGSGAVDLTTELSGPVAIPTDACLAVYSASLTASVTRRMMTLTTVEA